MAFNQETELVTEDEQICVINNNRVFWPSGFLGPQDGVQSTDPSPESCVRTFTDEGQGKT